MKQHAYGGGNPDSFWVSVRNTTGRRRSNPPKRPDFVCYGAKKDSCSHLTSSNGKENPADHLFDCFSDSHLSAMDDQDPKSVAEAVSDPHNRGNWIEAMDAEYKALVDNKTWELIHRKNVPVGMKIHRPIWRFKRKLSGRYKARLCFDGRFQVIGKDAWETSSPVPPFEVVRLILTFLFMYATRIVQADIPNAFLHPDVDAPVFMYQPEGYQNGDLICRLLKALYGLKQASWLWYLALRRVLVDIEGLYETTFSKCVFVGRWGDVWVIVIIYVDDLVLGSNDSRRVDKIIATLRAEFGIRIENEGIGTYLGIKCLPTTSGVFMSQTHLVEELISKVGVMDRKPTISPSNPKTYLEEKGTPFEDNKLYRSVIGILLWLGRCTRPDILFQTIALAQFQTEPTMVQWGAVQHLVRYLKGTANLGIELNSTSASEITCFFDAGHQNPTLRSRSSTGVIITYGGSPIAWSSNIQRSVAFSSAESEYVAISQGMRTVLWLHNLLSEIIDFIGSEGVPSPRCFTDSQPAINVINKGDPSMPATRHLAARMHWMIDLFSTSEFSLCHVRTEDNLADILTKSFTNSSPFISLRDRVMRSPPDGREC